MNRHALAHTCDSDMHITRLLFTQASRTVRSMSNVHSLILYIIYEIYPPEDVVWYTHPCTCACTLALLRTSPMLYMGVDTAGRAEQRMYDAHTYVSKCYHA